MQKITAMGVEGSYFSLELGLVYANSIEDIG
jgi:hypothetical protein